MILQKTIVLIDGDIDSDNVDGNTCIHNKNSSI